MIIYELNHCKYATVAHGEQGPLVVLLHGWPVTSHRWRLLAPALVSAGFKTLAIDLRGLGMSRCSELLSVEKASLAKEILEIVKQAFPKESSFSVIGHDWGGSIAIPMAALEPNISKLVIEEEIPPGIIAPLFEPGLSKYSSWHGAFHRQVGFAEKMIQGKEVDYLNYFLNLRANPNSLSAEDRRTYLAGNSEVIFEALSYYRTEKEDAVFFKNLTHNKLKIPVLAIGGLSGMGSAVEQSTRQMADNTIGKLFEHSGHYPAEEEPERFNQEVIAFLYVENH